MDKILRVAAYCRVSTDKSDQLNSLSNQQRYFADYIGAHSGWQLVEIYSDEGISGTGTKKRKNFNRMIADAETHRIDKILTKEVSRFARNTMDTLEYTRHLKELGVAVVFINDNIDTSKDDDEFLLTLMGAIAQKESGKTSQRVKWGQKRSMENGVVFGRDLLGYQVRSGKLFVIPDEAKVVRLIYHKFLNEGKGTHVIARELREAGICPKRGKEWSNTVILRVLRNEKYVGDLLQQKTFTPNYLTHEKKCNRGNVSTVFIKNHHEPIIDRITWEKTQAELQRRSHAGEQKRKHSNRYWCSGKLVCGECGQRFVSRTKKLKGGVTYKAWRCYAAANHGLEKTDVFGSRIGCDSPSVNEKSLCACVSYVINQIQNNRDMVVQDLMKEIKSVQTTDSQIDTAPLQERISSIENRKRVAINLVLDGIISKDDLKKQIYSYDQEIDALSRQIEEAQNSSRIHHEQANGIQDYISVINKIMNSDTENGLFYRELVDRIVIFKDCCVAVYLNGIPFGIKLHYRVSGRNDRYSVTIDSMETIN